jgi:hypothetical protein
MMGHRGHWAVALVITAGLAVSGCAKTSPGEAAQAAPARVEKVSGSDVNRLVLIQKAVERLGIATSPVRDVTTPGGPARTAVAYSSLVYDTNGGVSVFTNPDPLVFMRAPVQVDHIDGDQAILSQGPPPGTAIVTVGAPELLGIDSGIGGNE